MNASVHQIQLFQNKQYTRRVGCVFPCFVHFFIWGGGGGGARFLALLGVFPSKLIVFFPLLDGFFFLNFFNFSQKDSLDQGFKSGLIINQLSNISSHNIRIECVCVCVCVCVCLKKNQNAPRPSEHPPVSGGKMSKRLGGIKGCKYKTLSSHLFWTSGL